MRSPMLGLRTLIFKVNDLQTAKLWYSKAFQVEPYFDEPFYVGFNIGGFELGLDPDGALVQTGVSNATTYWGVEHIQQEFERLIGLGAQPISSPQNVGGEIIVATIADPWGNQFGLIYNPHFSIGSESD